MNTKTDYLSNIIDYEDWQTSFEFFQFIDSFWGPHTADIFANVYNFIKLPRFNSLFWFPETEGLDPFSQNWHDENNWLVPPISLICKTIRFMHACKAHATLIVPMWPSGPFWPQILSV